MVVLRDFKSRSRPPDQICPLRCVQRITHFNPHFPLQNANLTNDSRNHIRVVRGRAVNESARVLITSPACVWASDLIKIELRNDTFPVTALADPPRTTRQNHSIRADFRRPSPAIGPVRDTLQKQACYERARGLAQPPHTHPGVR